MLVKTWSNHRIGVFSFLSAVLISMMMGFVCVVSTGTFVVAPAELGEPAHVFDPVHRGADLAQREGGGGSFLRLE